MVSLLSLCFLGREWLADQDILVSTGVKPSDIPYSHQCRTGCIPAGVAEGDAKALPATAGARHPPDLERYESVAVDGAMHRIMGRIAAVERDKSFFVDRARCCNVTAKRDIKGCHVHLFAIESNNPSHRSIRIDEVISIR